MREVIIVILLFITPFIKGQEIIILDSTTNNPIEKSQPLQKLKPMIDIKIKTEKSETTVS